MITFAAGLAGIAAVLLSLYAVGRTITWSWREPVEDEWDYVVFAVFGFLCLLVAAVVIVVVWSVGSWVRDLFGWWPE